MIQMQIFRLVPKTVSMKMTIYLRKRLNKLWQKLYQFMFHKKYHNFHKTIKIIRKIRQSEELRNKRRQAIRVNENQNEEPVEEIIMTTDESEESESEKSFAKRFIVLKRLGGIKEAKQK